MIRRNHFKLALRQGIALLLLLCLFAGLLPSRAMAEPAQEQPVGATRATPVDYIAIAADLADPLVLNRRVDTNLTAAKIREIDDPCIVVYRDKVDSSFYAIDPHRFSENKMESAKVDVHVAASETFTEGTISNSPQYIKNLDPAVAEKLAMTFQYAGDPNGGTAGYLTDVGGDTNTASFAFRVTRSDGAEMQFSDGDFGIESNSGTATIGLNFSPTKTERPTVRLYRNKRSTALGGFGFQCNAYDGAAIKKWVLNFQNPSNGTPYTQLIQGTETNGTDVRSRYYLYEYFGEEVTYLYTAITEAAAYLQKVVNAEPDSANTKAFIDAFNQAVNTYKQYNVLPMADGGTDPRVAMIQAAEKLIAFYSFIDIPVEILDFRSDLFMMEHENDYFGLVHDYTTQPKLFSTSGVNLTLPGKVHNTSQGVPHYRTGLMEDTLHGGYPMYKREVVDFVAKLLYYKSNEEDMYNYLDTMRLQKLTDNHVDWNKTFYELLRGKDVPLGDLNSVLEETSGGKYGDSLYWSNMNKNSCYALAYYMLTNLWRPVTDTSSYAYNTPVPERNSLRLFKDIDGAYTIDANQNISYNSYMGNVMPRVDWSLTTGQYPCFTPINNLGFEKTGKETDLSPTVEEGYKTTNYNFTMHAYGSFVYYRDQDLYFEFKGDDDVYFYVNNTMALDLGGSHTAVSGRVNLNEKAEELGLVDGEVYTFDMFYAERRTAGSNLRFTTNIKIVDTDTLTTKGQYLDTQNGESMVNSLTGKGPELIDYAPVNVGDTVAYSFDLRNTRDVPLKQLTFADSTLGVTASHATLSLNSATEVTDLRLYYTTISNGTLNSSTPVVKTASQMVSLLANANTSTGGVYGALPAGSYRVNITSDTELKDLLSLGVPVNCKLSLYGFKRVVQAGDTPYINTVISECLTYDNKVITGTASRVITAFVAPKGKDTPVVLDYGKSIQVPTTDLKSNIIIASGSSVAVGNCVGLTTAGTYSGQLLKTLPLADTNYQGNYGTFTLSNSVITYTPNKLLDGVDSVFAVFNITGCTVTESGGKTVTYPYILLRLHAIPANMVYYEAEDFINEIALDKKTTDKNGNVTRQDQWAYSEPDGTTSDFLQEGLLPGEERPIPDYKNRTDILFFGFDKSTAATQRYKLSQYKGNNFDNYAWNFNGDYTSSVRVENGNLVIRPRADVADDSSLSIWADCSPGAPTIASGGASKATLNYNATNAEVLQIRVKAQGLKKGDMQPYFHLHLWTVNESGDPPKEGNPPAGKAARAITPLRVDEAFLTANEYVTWTFLLDGADFQNFRNVRGVRLYFRGAKSISSSSLGTLQYDYVYMGPAKDAPQPVAYGQDDSYKDDTYFSNGKSLYVEGNGIWNIGKPEPANYTNAYFSFTGTGFDLITRTGVDQAIINTDIYRDPERTDLVQGGQTWFSGIMEMYQVPTVSVHDLPYGTYYVTLGVTDALDVPFMPSLNHGNQFYFDALRIYDPIDVSEGAEAAPGSDEQLAYSAYCTDREAHPVLKEVRDILLSAEDFNALTGPTEGALFIDYEKIPEVTVPVTTPEGETTGETENITDPSLGVTEPHISANVVTYEKVGPNNEVYLAPQQLIAFKLYVYSQEIPDRLDVGCKLINGTEAELSAILSMGVNKGMGILEIPIRSSTAQFYAIPLLEEAFVPDTDKEGKACYSAYVIIQNKHSKSTVKTDHVLSITDIKAAYSSVPTPLAKGKARTVALREGEVELPVDNFVPVDFGVDGNLYSVVEGLLEEQMGINCSHSPDEWVVVQEALPGQEGMRARYCAICSALCETEILAAPGQIAFAGASVSLQSDLAIHYKVNEAFFTEQGYTEPFVVINDNGTEVILREYEVKDGKYAFIYRNIAPHRIGDTVTATLYAYYGDTLYCSESRDYSVADYCYNMLAKTEGNAAYDKLRTLLVDILLYGAKTQEYMSYRLDSLCTARLTEAQLSCGTAECRELEDHKNQTYETIDNPTVLWKGAGLNLRESVAIRFKIQAETYEDLEVRITVAGKTYSIYAKDFDHRTDGTYVHFKTINAAQMSEPVYATVYRGGEQVSHTICYSIESYAYSKQNDPIPHLADLVKRMMCYGDSTKAYVG